MGGVKLPLALAELGLIDEYESLVQPRLAGHGLCEPWPLIFIDDVQEISMFDPRTIIATEQSWFDDNQTCVSR